MLKIRGGQIGFTSAGIELKPWFTATHLLVTWNNVMFVSPVPGVCKEATQWTSYKGEPITSSTLSAGFKFYSFQIALIDRKKLINSASFLTKIWLFNRLVIRPLFTSEEKPHPTNGVIEASLNARAVKSNGAKVIRALSMIAEHSRFDILCWS